MRPGRLDRILYVGPPDKMGREEILKIRTKIMTVGPDFDIGNIAEIVSLHSTSIHFVGLFLNRLRDIRALKSHLYVKKLRF